MKSALFVLVLMSAAAAQGFAAEETQVTTTLREVVVTATKTEKTPEDVTQSVTVISGDEIRRSGATDVAKAIQNTTGVHISEYGTPGSVESLKMRGAYSSQVLVLLDGVRMNSSRDGGFDLSLIPVALEDIDRIEIVRGASSALYGSDAVGGVINIITKRPQENRTTMKAAAGSHGYDELYLRNSGRLGGFFYSLSGDRETSDGYRVNSDLYQWKLSGKAGYDFSKNSSLEVSTNYLANDVGSPGSDKTPQNPIAYPTSAARQQERNDVFGAAYRTRIAPSVDLKVSAYRKLDNLTYRDPLNVDFFMNPDPINNRYETRSDIGEAQVSWLITGWNQVTAGYEARHDYLKSFDNGAEADHSASLSAYYIQDELSIGEPLLIVLGARHDEHSVYGAKLSPKASARLAIASTGTIIRASYGKSFRAPTFNDLYFTSSFAVGNPDLKPESAREYEAGIEQKIGKDLVVKAIGFDRTVQDLIQWDWSVFPMTVVNIGRVRIRGSEYEASYRVAEIATVAVNYTYTNPVNELTGEKIYYTIPQKQAKAVLTLFPQKAVFLTAEGRSVENYVRSTNPVWHYSVMDAKVGAKVGKVSELFFAMTNVFDRKYEAVQGYPMPPREIRGGATLQF